MPAYFPIIYVRGFAFSDRDIEEATDDPTNGFNIGTTHAHQGYSGRPIPYHFPGPFVRLITDHGYKDAMHGYGDSVGDNPNPRQTLWIHRYYEPYSDKFGGHGEWGRPSILEAAQGLLDLARHVTKECFGEQENDKRVILIAHSMGGLICRSLIQRLLPKGEAASLIEKVVTYGTPHGGIPLSFGAVRYHGLGNFSGSELIRALAPAGTDKKKFDRQTLINFDPEKFLCVIGTNHLDYGVGRGIVRSFAGDASDGLVQIRHAWVRKAPRVYVYRSHSGRYGLVSSAEAWAAIERFLFGGLRAKVQIGPDRGVRFRPLSPPNWGPDSQTVSLLDVECTIGKEGLRINDRRADHLSALIFDGTSNRNAPGADEQICTFYFKKEDFEDNRYGFAISFRMRTDTYRGEKLRKSVVSMMQHLIGWVSKSEGQLVLEYQWLGHRSRPGDLSDNTCEIPIPPSSFGETSFNNVTLRIRLTEIDEDGFASENQNWERNSGGNGPAEEVGPNAVVGAAHWGELTSDEGGEALQELPVETEDA